MKKIFLALVITVLTAGFAVADTVYLRDGRTVRGTLIGFINGRFAVRVVADSAAIRRGEPGEIQYFRPNEVDRIEIDGRSLDDLRFESRTVQVGLEPNWVDTGIDVRRNERVTSAYLALREQKFGFHMLEAPPVVRRFVAEAVARA